VATTIKAVDMDLVVMSAFLGHMAIDTGQFAPLSPISYAYFQLDPFRIPFAVCALLCAVSAGLFLRSMKADTGEGS